MSEDIESLDHQNDAATPESSNIVEMTKIQLDRNQKLIDKNMPNQALGIQWISTRIQRDALYKPTHFFLSTVQQNGRHKEKSPFLLRHYPWRWLTKKELWEHGLLRFENTKNIWEINIDDSVLRITNFHHNEYPRKLDRKKKSLGILRKTHLDHIIKTYSDLATIEVIQKSRTSGKQKKVLEITIAELESFCEKHL